MGFKLQSFSNENSFRDWVELEQKKDTTKRKGERTRDRIRLVTIELLNSIGYRELKVSDICDAAKISTPVLYIYYASKEILVMDILSEFLEQFMVKKGDATGFDPYQSMFNANLRWLSLARANTGLMKCLLQFSEEAPEFAKLFASESNKWYYKTAQSLTHRFPAANVEEAQIHLCVSALGGMIDDLTRKLFAERDENIVSLVDKVAPDDVSLAHFITSIWYRALYCADPKAENTIRATTQLPLANTED